MGSDLIFREKLFPRILGSVPAPHQVSSSEEGCRKDQPSTDQKGSRLAGVSTMQGLGVVYNPSCPSLSRPLSTSCHEKGQKMRGPLMTQIGAAGVFGKELDLAQEPRGRV